MKMLHYWIMNKIIKKGSKLPCKVTRNFKPVRDYPILIQVYEGEKDFVKDNYYLGRI